MNQNHVFEQTSFEYEEEEEEEEDITENHDLITINLLSTNIQVKYSQLCKYSLFIPNKYLKSDFKDHFSKDIQQFEKENLLNEETIVYFFKFFNDERIKITNDKYRDLFKLSEFLQVNSLKKRLIKFKNRHFKDIDFIITTILEELSEQRDEIDYENDFEYEMEQLLIDRINECFINDKFKNLPVSLIYQIIEKSDKSKLSNDLLFDFIKGTIDKLYVLFSHLNIQKLSFEKFQEFHEMVLKSNDEKTKLYLQYLNFDFEYIKQTKKIDFKRKKYKNECKQKEEEIQLLHQEHQKQLNSKEDEIQLLHQNYQKQLNDKEEEIFSLDVKKNLMITENKNLLEKLNSKEEEIQLLNQNYQQIQNQQKELQSKLDKLKISIEKLSECLNSYFAEKPNIKEAIYLLKILSDEGNSISSYLLGLIYERGEFFNQNFSESFKYFEKSSLQGNSSGFIKIGSNYQRGYGVEKDYSKALEYFKKSAELGNSSALVNIGNCYKNGQGVNKNYSNAIEFYEKSAELGNSSALVYLGNCYKNGEGFEKNPTKAFELFLKSAFLGNSYGMVNLGNCYKNGFGVDEYHSMAFDFYQKSADCGNSEGLINLGICYENGLFVEQDYSKALNCYKDSLELGNSEAESFILDLQKKTSIFTKINHILFEDK